MYLYSIYLPKLSLKLLVLSDMFPSGHMAQIEPPHKMVKHTQAIYRRQVTNCLSMFDHFVGIVRRLEGVQDVPWKS